MDVFGLLLFQHLYLLIGSNLKMEFIREEICMYLKFIKVIDLMQLFLVFTQTSSAHHSSIATSRVKNTSFVLGN